MKKLFVIFLLVNNCSTEPQTQKIAIIPGITDPHSVLVDQNELIFIDGFTVHAYSMEPFQLKYKFGNKGEVPEDFKYRPQVNVTHNHIVGQDYTKLNWFSKKGELAKVKQFNEIKGFDLNSEMILKPIRENYVSITASHELSKRYVHLLDSNFKKIKKLYDGKYDWGDGKSFNINSYRIEVVCYKDKIFISDSEKGFFIEVFDYRGEHLWTINKNEEIEKIIITENDKKETIDEILKTQPQWICNMVKKDPRFHEYYPQINHFFVSKDKIYIITDNVKNKKNEIIILNLEGNIIKKVYQSINSKKRFRRILRYDPYTIFEGKLYELVKIKETENWEFYITKL